MSDDYDAQMEKALARIAELEVTVEKVRAAGIHLVKSHGKRVKEAEAETQKLRALLEAITTTFEAAVRHADNKGRGGQQVPFHGDFCHVPPSATERMRWWIREFRAVLPMKEET